MTIDMMLEPIAVNKKDLNARLWMYKPRDLGSHRDVINHIHASIPKHPTLRDVIAVLDRELVI